VANATTEDLHELSREDLNDRALEAGVDNPEDLPNKQAVIDAINEAEGYEEVPEGEGEVLHTSDPDARIEGVLVGDVEPDPSTETHASDAADYAFPPGGDVDVALLSDDPIEGETEAVLAPDSKVILAESDEVPEELWGHPALVISINDEDPEAIVYEVRTRDEHNSVLFLEKDDFAQTYPGNVGVRGFGA
jgi:hypothetical protein